MARLFIALDVPANIRQHVLEFQQGLGQLTEAQLHPEPYSNLHMTLAFLGETPDEQVPLIREAIDNAVGHALDVSLSGPIEYRELDKLAMLVFTDTGGQALWHRLNEELNRVNGYTPQFPEAWLPHITVVRFPERPNLQPELPQMPGFNATDIHIYKSVKLPTGGAQYQVVAATPTMEQGQQPPQGIVREEIPRDMLEGYRRQFTGEPVRYSIYAGEEDSSHPYFAPYPYLSAFADVFVESEQWVSIGFVAVEPKFRGQKLARALIQHLYDTYPNARIRWGKLMEDEMIHLKNDFRDRFPDRTAAGTQYDLERTANIFDPIQDGLDQKVFKGIEPRPTTLSFIYDHMSKVLERELGFNGVEYMDLYLTGSLTTYQWSDTSDCDISVFVQWDLWPIQTEPQEIRRQLVRIMIDKLDGIYLPGTQHPIQHFVVPVDTMPEDLYKPGMRSAYSFKENKWVVPPERERVHDVAVELPVLYRRAQEMADKMEILLDTGDHETAKDFWHQIHKKRTLDQQEGLGDFSEGNIIYKYLLHNGYFDRIRTELGEYIAKTAQETRVVTDKSGKKVHRLIDVEHFEGYGEMAVTACNKTLEVEGITEGLEVNCGNCLRSKASAWKFADGMRWDNLDDIPAGGMMDAPSNDPPYSDGTVRDFPNYDPDADSSLKVIYDFERDEIILGTRAQAAEMPSGKIVGEYTEEDVILYDHHEAWLNANYFKKLWGHSFPDRPLRSLFIEDDGEHHRISATLEDHGEDTPQPEAPQARVGLDEGRPQGREEEQEGAQALPLERIKELAWQGTPDWDAWCDNACQRVSEYLTEQGIPHEIETAGTEGEDDVGPNWPFGTHTFIRLQDGSVLDPTISQYAPELGEDPMVFPPDHKWYQKFAMPEQHGSFMFPTIDEVFEAAEHAYSESVGRPHPGWRPNSENAIGSAVGSAINHHVYNQMNDPIDVASHLIWRIQATQAGIDGNKRTGTTTGLAFLETHGFDTEPIPEDESLYNTIEQASTLDPEEGAKMISEYLRQYVVPVEGDYTSDPMGEDDDPNG